MNTNLFLNLDDPSFVNIRVHSWPNFLNPAILNIEVENAVIYAAIAFSRRASHFIHLLLRYESMASRTATTP
jgi:hypothetical protein